MWWRAFCKKWKTVTAAGFTALVILLLLFFTGEQGSLRRTEALFASGEEGYVRAAEAALAEEPVSEQDLRGVWSLNVWPCGRGGAKMVDFFVDGRGMGSQTSYWGFYTTTDGLPAGFQGADMALTPEEGGWSWREEHGDNAYFTCLLAPGWYYYRMEF